MAAQFSCYRSGAEGEFGGDEKCDWYGQPQKPCFHQNVLFDLTADISITQSVCLGAAEGQRVLVKSDFHL